MLQAEQRYGRGLQLIDPGIGRVVTDFGIAGNSRIGGGIVMVEKDLTEDEFLAINLGDRYGSDCFISAHHPQVSANKKHRLGSAFSPICVDRLRELVATAECRSFRRWYE
jgi:hypothetical protein